MSEVVAFPKQEQFESFSYDDVPGQSGTVFDITGAKKLSTDKNPGHREHVTFSGAGVVVGCHFIELNGALVKVLKIQALEVELSE